MHNRVEILIIFSISLLAALTLVGFLSYRDAEKLITDSIEGQFQSILLEIDFDVRQRQEKLAQIAKNVANLPAIPDAVAEGKDSSDWLLAEAYASELLTRARIAAEEVGNVVIFDNAGNVLMDLEKYRTSTAPWPNSPAKDTTIYGNNLRDPKGAPLLHAAVPVIRNGAVVGTCAVSMNMSSLRNFLQRRFFSDANLRLALVNDMGVVVLSSSEDYLIPGERYDTTPLRHALMTRYDALIRLEHDTRLGMSLRMPDQKLTAIISDDHDTLLAPAEKLWSNMVLYTGCVALLGVVLVALYVHQLSKRTASLQAKYSTTVELAALPTWEWVMEDSSQHNNAHFSALLGYEAVPTILDKEEARKLLHPEDREVLRPQVAKLKEGENERFYWEARMRHKDGHWHWVESVGSVLEWDAHGDPARIFGIAMDGHEKKLREVTDAKYRSRLEAEVEERTNVIREREASLRQERALLQAVLNNMPDIIYFRDMQKRLIGANRAFYEFFNISSEAALGKTINDPVYTGSVDDSILQTQYEQDDYVLSTGKPLQLEEALELTEDMHLYFETVKSIMVDEEGSQIGMLGVSRDITQRKNMDVALERAKEDALAANRAKSEFLANMSHEIRTPLNGILGLNHLALQLNPSDELRRYLVRVEISARNLLSIVNDLLDFSKIEAGRMQLEYLPFSLEDTVTTAMDMIRPQAEQKGVDLNLYVSPEVPHSIYGDSLRFGQVLLNLLSNAVKFTHQGSVELKLWTGPAQLADPEDDRSLHLYISVKDTGIGMSEEQLNRLFSPFTQADTSITRKYGGTGLGLVISRSLVECMYGLLSVESSPGKGSRFIMELDVTRAETVCNSESTEQSDSTPFEGKRLLLAEDNEINQIVAVEMLKNLGCITDVANDGQEAVRMAQGGNYDAVLMDIQMPNMDGYTATRLLREIGYEPPIIAMTANAMPEDKQKTKDAGMQAHVVKPIDPVSLREILGMWL